MGQWGRQAPSVCAARPVKRNGEGNVVWSCHLPVLEFRQSPFGQGHPHRRCKAEPSCVMKVRPLPPRIASSYI